MINNSYAQEHFLDMYSERTSQTYVVKSNRCDFAVLARGSVRAEDKKDCFGREGREAEVSTGKS